MSCAHAFASYAYQKRLGGINSGTRFSLDHQAVLSTVVRAFPLDRLLTNAELSISAEGEVANITESALILLWATSTTILYDV